MPAEVAVFLVLTTFALMFSFIFWISKRSRNEQARNATNLQLQTRMLDKFSSASEFVDFVSTPQGQKFMAASTDRTEKLNPLIKLYQSLRWGLVLSFVGIGFIFLSITFEDGMVVPGVLFLTLGLGFLLSAIIGQKLARSWGLLDKEDAPRTFTEPARMDG